MHRSNYYGLVHLNYVIRSHKLSLCTPGWRGLAVVRPIHRAPVHTKQTPGGVTWPVDKIRSIKTPRSGIMASNTSSSAILAGSENRFN